MNVDTDTLTSRLGDNEFWDSITTNEELARQAFTNLTAVVTDLHAQAAERKADVEAAHLQGHQMGPEGKQRYFQAQHEYREWLVKMRRFQRIVERRRQQLRGAVKSGRSHAAQQVERDRDKTHRRVHLAALAQAIYDHQMACGADGDEADIELWSVLNRTVSTAEGSMSLRAAVKSGYFDAARSTDV